jgi:hypothetical protein
VLSAHGVSGWFAQLTIDPIVVPPGAVNNIIRSVESKTCGSRESATSPCGASGTSTKDTVAGVSASTASMSAPAAPATTARR